VPATPVPVRPARPEAAARRGLLWLRREDGSVVEVSGDRFVVGRGAHCDLIIDSAKISREHAAFVRDAEGWWIEDLGSSNGTWYRGERVKRRRVVHGDEFFLCAEKFRCALH
jgi:pSer/pThr/pTyr-binding forkhead associated (FHA) protein